jgi:hypothetical protein
MSNLTEHHYQYTLQIVDYLYTYRDLVMTFNALPGSSHLSIDVFSKTLSHQDLGLCAYSDASFADAEDRKSTLEQNRTQQNNTHDLLLHCVHRNKDL